MRLEIRVTPMTREDSNLKGLATVVFQDAFAVNSISIMESQDGRQYVSFPSVKTQERDMSGKQVYKEQAFPVTSEFSSMLRENILKTLDLAINGEEGKMIIDDEKRMKYRIGIRPVDRENTKAHVSLTFDGVFVVNGITVMDGKKGLFVNMPTRKSKEVDENGEAIYKDVANPITAEFREGLYNAILEDYAKVTKKDLSLEDSVAQKAETAEHANPFESVAEEKEEKTAAAKVERAKKGKSR